MKLLRFALVAFVAAAGCSLNVSEKGRDWDFSRSGSNVGKAVNAAEAIREALAVPPEIEAEMGREAAANLAVKYGTVDDDGMLKYLNLVGQAVARGADRDDVKYRFGILRTNDVNAYAAPGGFIFVTVGLLKILNDEAQLAGVLAHEIQHVDKKHALRALRKANVMKASVKLAEGLSDKKGMDTATGWVIGLLEKGFDRSDEREADVEGIALLGRAGYDPSGLPRALEQHHSVEGEKRSLPFTERHPSFEDRMQSLSAVRGLPDTGAVNKKRFQKNVVF